MQMVVRGKEKGKKGGSGKGYGRISLTKLLLSILKHGMMKHGEMMAGPRWLSPVPGHCVSSWDH